MKTRQKAAGIHLLISMVIATIIGLVFSFVYFPGYYFSVFDGWRRFLLIIGVDVVLGPLLTLIIFNVKKPKKELIRDVSLIAVIQLCALLYGLYVFALTRPVYTVFDGKSLTFFCANEYEEDVLAKAPEPYRTLPKFGPQEVYSRPSGDAEDMFGAFLPSTYEPMAEDSRKEMLKNADPLTKLDPALTPEQLVSIKENLPSNVKSIDELRAIPARSMATHSPYFWAIIDPQGKIISAQPVSL